MLHARIDEKVERLLSRARGHPRGRANLGLRDLDAHSHALSSLTFSPLVTRSSLGARLRLDHRRDVHGAAMDGLGEEGRKIASL